VIPEALEFPGTVYGYRPRHSCSRADVAPKLACRWIPWIGQIPEDRARADTTDDIYQECVHELPRPWPHDAKMQALATLCLAETQREVAGQVAELSRQITLAESR